MSEKYIIKNRLREFMAIKGRNENRHISQRKLAEEIGVSKITVDRWAQNNVTRIDDDILIKLCVYFGIQPGDLLIMEEVPDDEGQSKTPLSAA